MRIMIVENEITLVNSIIRIYKFDHEIIPFYTLDSALEYVKSNDPPDIVLLDLRMNGKDRDGIEVYDLIRLMWGSDVPVSIITGCSDEMLDKAVDLSKKDLKLTIYKKPLDTDTLDLIVLQAG